MSTLVTAFQNWVRDTQLPLELPDLRDRTIRPLPPSEWKVANDLALLQSLTEGRQEGRPVELRPDFFGKTEESAA